MVVVAVLAVLAATLLVAGLRHAGSDDVNTTSAGTSPRGTAQAAGAQNPIQLENALPGFKGWQLPLAPVGTIEGYPSEQSVAGGLTLSLHVSTRPVAGYRVDVLRLGWYHGDGARRVACVPNCSGQKRGTPFPVPEPDQSGEVRAGWPVTDEVAVPPSWLSGYYVARLVLTTGPDRGKAANVPFLVRPSSGRTSAMLVQAPVNTWQAYNNWGGKSLYDFNSSSGAPATRVSFERPIVQDKVLNYPFSWEYPLVRFLEREGYDVAYVTDVDVHRDPAELRKHRLVMTAGHDEYWSKEIRSGLDAAVAARTNLAFMGGNTGVWQVRYEDTEHTLVGYKSAADPIPDGGSKTLRFRELQTPRPECQLLGVQSAGGLAGANDPPRAYAPTTAAETDSWFVGTGLSPSSVLANLVGYEWDTIAANCNVPALTVLFHYEGSPSNADAVRYTAPSGARVFSSGSLQFTWGLDDFGGHARSVSSGLQQFMRNALADLAS